MKITIFGATGQTGLILTKMALENGHEVTAFVRSPQKITFTNEKLTIIKGSIYDKEEVSAAMKGSDAVVSCLGGEANKKTTTLTDMTKVIVDAMKENDISRISYIATAGIHKEIPGLFINLIINLLFKNVINDHKGAVDYIIDNKLSFTIARPLSLVEGSLTNTYRKTMQGVPKRGKNLSREDLASFLLESIEESKYINESVGLAY